MRKLLALIVVGVVLVTGYIALDAGVVTVDYFAEGDCTFSVSSVN